MKYKRNIFTACLPVLLALFLNSCSTSTSSDELKLIVVADFSYQRVGDCSDPVEEIVIENLSKNTHSYHWNFGDGATSTEVNPVKVYARAGEYIVTLTAFTSESASEVTQQTLTIGRNSDGLGPAIEFSHTKETKTSISFTVKLTNASSHRLDFGDGTSVALESTDTVFNYKHTYPGFNRYGAVIVATGSEGASCSEIILELDP